MVNQLVSEDQPPNPRLKPGDNNPPDLIALLNDQLIETYKLEFEKILPLAERANALPEKIENDQHQAAVTQVYLDVKELFDQLDTARKNENRPLTEAVNNTFKPNRIDRLERMLVVLRERSDIYARLKKQQQFLKDQAEKSRLAAIAEEARKKAEIAAEFGDTEAMINHSQEVMTAHISIAQTTAAAPSTADVARVRGDGGGMSTGREVWAFEILDITKVDLNALRAHFSVKDIEKAIGKAVKATKQHTKIEGVRVYEDVGTTFRRS